MENRKFGENEVSEQNKEALQSETRKEGVEFIKAEITHFTDTPKIIDFEAVKMSKNDNIYGIRWGRLVCDYLKTAYPGEGEDIRVVSWGNTYKVLNRGKVTSFYDAAGNTLFDVENERLKKEYEWLMNMDSGDVEEDLDAGEDEEREPEPVAPKMTESKDAGVQDSRPVKQQAEEKLKNEIEKAKDKSFAEPIIGYLLERCKEDEGLAEDVVQEHKTWQKCFGYIYSRARKQAHGNCAAVRDDVVYEWAEDYYHKDDKAEEEEKARKEAERKDKQKKVKAGRPDKTKKKTAKTVPVPEKKEEEPKKQPEPKKNNKDMEGQLDMFSMMGI